MKKVCTFCQIKYDAERHNGIKSRAKFCSSDCRVAYRESRSWNPEKIKCPYCEKEFKPSEKDTKFCSRPCSTSYMWISRRKAVPKKECPNCGKEFTSKNKKLCSPECVIAYIRTHRKNAVPIIDCLQCGKTFKPRGKRNKFCSPGCAGIYSQREKTLPKRNCNQCGRLYKPRRSGSKFCSKPCTMTFTNEHKTFGNRISKLELFLKAQLDIIYPDNFIIYNGKETIGSELDIYIPMLKLAIEINGPLHYIPIYGQDTLEYIKKNDRKKRYLCKKNGIEFHVINSSKQNCVTEETCPPFLNTVTKIIDLRISKDTE